MPNLQTAERWHRVLRAFMETPYLPIVLYLSAIAWVALASGRGHGILPIELQGAVPNWAPISWTALIALSGPGCLFGRLWEATRTESIGLTLLVVGVLCYGIVILAASPSGVGISAGVVSAAVASMGGIRMRVLSLSRRASHRALDGDD